MRWIALCLLLGSTTVAGCGDDGGDGLPADGGRDGGQPPDGGRDGGAGDGGAGDGGSRDGGSRDGGPQDGGGSTGSCGAVPTLPASGTTTVPGELDASDPTFPRPLGASCPSALETAYESPFDTFTFCNDGPTATFEISQLGTLSDATLTLQDPYLVVYDGPNLPGDVRQCLAQNDDGVPGTGDSRLSVEVASGQTITVVASTFEPAATGVGTYRLTLTR